MCLNEPKIKEVGGFQIYEALERGRKSLPEVPS